MSRTPPQVTQTDIKQAVKDHYGQVARRAAGSEATSCCGPAPSPEDTTGGAADLYSPAALVDLPDAATAAAAGCGDPTAISELRPGDTVLDLGSGGGIDCFLARQKVGPQGRVIGLDMTPDMLDLARRNAATLGYDNVEFHQGEIENIPLPDSLVDVIISNCVINLSTDKDAVFREAFRVLRPGGRLCVSDIVLKRPLPIEIRENLEEWAGCIAGALVKEDYLDRMRKAGFATIEIRDEKDYSASVERGEQIMSITLRALKP